MIKVFIPVNKGRIKTSIRGFWRNDKGITFYDYLKIESHIFSELEFLKVKYNQESLFYKRGSLGCIYYNDYKVDILENRIYAEVKPEDLRAEIKEALVIYSGITIYKEGRRYFKEVFYK